MVYEAKRAISCRGKKVKRFITTILAFTILFIILLLAEQNAYATDAIASGTCEDSLIWTLDNDGVLTISGNGEMKDYSTDSLAPWSSYRSQINSVNIEDGVLSVGSYSFYNLYKATEVSFPDTIYRIGDYSFSNCTKVDTVELPDTLISIGDYAFKDCTKLRSITIPAISCQLNNYGEATTGNCMLTGCTSLTSIDIGGESIPQLFDFNDNISVSRVTLRNTVKNIGSDSFNHFTDLEEIILPEHLEYIGQRAFARSGLKEVSFPDSVLTIGLGAFNDCGDLSSVHFNDCLQTIGNGAFCGTSIKTLTIPNSVSDLGRYTFENCTELKSVSLGDGITELKSSYGEGYWKYDRGVFKGCISLETVDLNNVESIGFNCFKECSSLKTIHFPSSLKSLHPGSSFYGESNGSFDNSGLESVYIDDLDAWIQNYSMPFMINGIDVYLNNELLEDIVIPDSMTVIGDEKFVGINSIKRVTIPDSITSIGETDGVGRSFQDCRNLTSITIPESVSNVCGYTFQGCENLQAVVFEGEDTIIQQGAFLDCSRLSSIVLPRSFKRGMYYGLTFQNCLSLDSIDLREATAIDISDFAGCEKLKEVYLPATITTISNEFHVNDNSYSPALTFDGVFIVDENSDAYNFVVENGFKYDLSTGHQVSEWQESKIPTCTDGGVDKGVCETCGREVTKETPPVGHTFSEEYVVDKEPTCTTEGSKSRHCVRCEATTEVTAIEALGHDWNDGEITTEPTCTEEGVKTFTCDRCKDTRTEKIEALDHAFADEFTIDTEPGCTTEGSKSRHCVRCEATTEVTPIEANGHSFGDWIDTTPSTCEGTGVHQRSCEVCGFTESEATDPIGHDVEDHYTVDVPATCATDGSQSRHCSRCDAVFDSEVISATGHNYGDWVIIKEATCTQKGSKEKICSKCSDKITEEIVAKGHSWNSEPTVDKAATCTSAGSQSIHCARCSETKEQTTIPALGHDWNTTAIVDKKATCTENGVESIHCSRCDAIKEGSSTAIPAKGHNFSAWTTTKAATETAVGEQSHKCSACGTTETKTIAQLKPTLPAVKISKPKAAKKAATIKWKKVSKANQKKIASIQIQYSTDKAFKTSVKTVTAKKSAASKKITKLTSKKTYYVRIRVYKKDAKGVHVSAWSAIKSVKAK